MCVSRFHTRTKIVRHPREAIVLIVSEEHILLLPKKGCWLGKLSTLKGYEHVPKVLHLALFSLSLIFPALEIIRIVDTSEHFLL